MIKYVLTMPCQIRDGLFKIKTLKTLAQVVDLETFISNNHVDDTFTVNVRNPELLMLPDRSHELLIVVINPDNLISIQTVDRIILDLKRFAEKYLYLAVNKFMVYSDVVIDPRPDVDFDQKLLEHWQQIVKATTIWAHSNSQDRGDLGNFVHPVTNLMFKI